MKKLGTLILGAILTLGIGAGISFKPSTDVAKASSDAPAYSFKFTDSNWTGLNNWDSSYKKRTITYTDTGANKKVSVEFESANKQSTTITDVPVTKGKYVIVKLTEADTYFDDIVFYCKQWASRTQTMTLHTSNDGGTTFNTTTTKSTDFTLNGDFAINDKINAFKITFSSTSNQVGIVGFDAVYAASSTPSVKISGNTSALVGEEVTLTSDAENTNWEIVSDSKGATLSATTGKTTILTSTEKGLVTVQATATGYEPSSYSVNFWTPTSYNLVENDIMFNVGSNVIIAAAKFDVALSTTQNTNNRGQADITKEDKTAIFDADANEVQILRVEEGAVEGTYAFNTGAGYLCAASSGDNLLKTEEKLTNNSSWNVQFSENGIVTIKSAGSFTRNWLRYNSLSSIFSCYGSGQEDIVLYTDYVATEPDISINSINDEEILPGETGTLEISYFNISTEPTVIWSSSNPNVATINETTGEYTAISAGETTITATVEYNSITLVDTIVLKVSIPATIETVEISEILTYEAASSKVIRVIGKVTEITNDEYGNIYIKSLDSDDTIYVYGCTRDTSKLTKVNSGEGYYNGTYSSTTSFNNACEVNDVIVLEAIVGTYNSKVQLQGVIFDPTAKLLADEIYVRAGGWENDKTTTNCAKNYDFAKALFLGLSSTEQAAFKGDEYIDAATTYVNWCSANSDTNPYGPAQTARELIINNASTTMIVIVIALAALSAFAFVYVAKRKQRKNEL